MRIAILSDVHDARDHLAWFLDYAKTNNIDHIIHLGDYGATNGSIKPILASGIPTYGILGNNDGNVYNISRLFLEYGGDISWTVYRSWTLDGIRIFAVHFDDLHETIARSGDYDLVLYGHDHTRASYTIGDTQLCNP